MTPVRLSERPLRSGALTPIGAMHHQVKLLVPGARNQDGSPGSLLEYVTSWAKVSFLSGRELDKAQQISEEITHVVAIPYLEGVTADMLVLFSGRTLVIQAIEDPDEHERELRLYCAERGQNAGVTGIAPSGAPYVPPATSVGVSWVEMAASGTAPALASMMGVKAAADEDITIALTAASKQSYWIVQKGSGIVTITDGSSTIYQLVNAGQSVILAWDGSEWLVIGGTE